MCTHLLGRIGLEGEGDLQLLLLLLLLLRWWGWSLINPYMDMFCYGHPWCVSWCEAVLASVCCGRMGNEQGRHKNERGSQESAMLST